MRVKSNFHRDLSPLLRHHIPMMKDITRERAGNLMRWSTRASVSVALLLVIGKAAAWGYSGSVAMLGSMTDSALDMVASLVTLYAVSHALQPADDDHRFGHGKAEALAGLFQASIMSGSALFLLLQSIEHLASGNVPVASELVINVSIFAIVLTLALVAFQSYVVRHTGSLAISGDHLHYKGDLLLNLGVIVAAWASAKDYAGADGAFGILIAGYILHGAWHVGRPALDMLMDKEFSEEAREKIFNLVMESPDVIGLHDLRTRSAGRDHFIQMHIEVDGDISVHAGHFIADEVEAVIGEHFPDADILIHIDPPSTRSSLLTQKELTSDKE